MQALPDGFDVRALAGDLGGDGVWLVAEDGMKLDLFHWTSSDHTLHSYDLTSIALLGGLGDIALAVAPTGKDVWVGVQANMFHIDVATGLVEATAAPKVLTTKLAVVDVPAQNQQDHNVVDIAPSATGSIAVVESNASQIALMSSTGATSMFDLPADTVAREAVFNPNGDLAVALTSYPSKSEALLLLRFADGATKTISSDALFVQAFGDSFVIGDSASGELKIIKDGLVTGANWPIPARSAQDPGRALIGYAPLTLPDSDIAFGTASGIDVISQDGARNQALSLPRADCENMSGGHGGSDSSPGSVTPDQTCAVYPLQFSADHAGNIWYLSSGPDNGVDEIFESDYESK